MLLVKAPGDVKEVLLHSCCAPCSGAVIECLLASGIKPVVFFSNSNIVPSEEYTARLNELQRYCANLGVELIEDEYNHEAWLSAVLEKNLNTPIDQSAQEDQNDHARDQRQRQLAAAPERGERCLNCFKFRLQRAAQYAAKHGLQVLTTTLASSRWKSLEQVAEAGDWATQATGSPLLFWNQNWRKGGLQERRNQIICEQQFYNQNWCGCEFSHRDTL